MDLKTSLKLLRNFLSPIDISKLENVNTSELSLSSILQTIIDSFAQENSEFYESLSIIDEKETIWKFALICLNLMTIINDSSYDLDENNCYLSINDEKLVSFCCELITCFGIHFNLEENIGVSIEKLSKYGINIIKKRRDVIDLKLRNQRLEICLIKLFEIKKKKRAHFEIFNNILYRKYMHDILCALIQVCYSPNSEIKNKENLKQWLEIDLFEEADGAIIVNGLIIAQGSSKNVSVKWFANVIGSLLTKSLMRPNSVMNVVRAILNQINALTNITLASDWKKCDMVAKILAQCPREVKIEDYFEFISPQIINIYFNQDQYYAKHFFRVAGSLYSLFAQRWPDLTQKYLTKRLLFPFTLNLSNYTETLSLNAKDFRLKLGHLHLVYVSSTEPNWQILNQIPIYLLNLIFEIFFLLYKKNNSQVTFNKCKDILSIYIKMKPNATEINEILVNFLLNFILSNDDIILKFDNFQDDCELEDLICINPINTHLKNFQTTKKINFQLIQMRCTCLVYFIKSLDDNEFELNFIFHLFEKINDCITNKQKTLNNIDNNSNNAETLLNIEETILSNEKEIILKIAYYTQLSYLFERIEPKLIIEKYSKIVYFCEIVLKSVLKLFETCHVLNTNDLIKLKYKEDQDIKNSEIFDNEYEIIKLILSIISIFTNGLVDIENHVKNDLQVLVPLLKQLMLMNWDNQKDITDMAESLYISLSTYCGIKTDKFNNDPKREKDKSQHVLIEEINDQNNLDDYDKAICDLNDPLIPVKAHGLISLRRLIENKNEKCLKNKSILIEIFMKNLKSDDSYVYLAAINGLIAMVDLEPSKILDVLFQQYLDISEVKLDEENRLKIGEVLTKTVKKFDELVPFYGDRLLNAFLTGCKHDSDLFRASSLSNLGETCKLLKYAINKNIYEIINCLSSLIETDSSLQVKRSAIMVLKMIIEGLKNENFIAIIGDSLLPLYKLLNKTKRTTNDEIIKLNCQLTNDYLNELIKASMFPKQELIKEIKILH